jgi:hypothetical protein
METINTKALKKIFAARLAAFRFELTEVESYDYALYAKFLSSTVGIYFDYEFRDRIPLIQITKLKTDKLEPRLGLYTLQQLYKDKDYKLLSFYLDEIISFREGGEYKSFFKDVKTVEDAIKIATELVEKYAVDFVSGDENSFNQMETWFRVQILNS